MVPAIGPVRILRCDRQPQVRRNMLLGHEQLLLLRLYGGRALQIVSNNLNRSCGQPSGLSLVRMPP